MGKANLTYYLFEGVLVGMVGGQHIHVFAESGGGGGSTASTGPSEPGTVNNVYRTGRKMNAGVRGGAIPTGKYTIATPSPFHKGRGAQLTPADPKHFAKATGDRGGFWIHGRGPRGSDGCIVPLVAAQFQNLLDGLEKDGGGTLFVLETMDGGRFV
jgi:hypothetical protein